MPDDDESLLLEEEAAISQASLDQLNTLARDLRRAANDGELSDAEVSHDGSIWQNALRSHILPSIAEVYGNAYDAQIAEFEADAPTQAATKKTSKDGQANAAEYAKTISNRLVGVADNIFVDLRRELSQAIKGGETPEQMAARVDRVFAERGGDNWQGRASVIARTEAAAAINAGRVQAARKWAKDYDLKPTDIVKTWLTQKDDRVRDSHRQTHGQKRPLSSPFTVGGVKLMHPGDPAGPADECVSCRCTVRLTTANTLRAAADLIHHLPEEDPMTATITEPEVEQDTPTPQPWHGVLAPEGVLSGDHRKFAEGALRTRDLPLPLMYQDAQAVGHDGAVRVANIQGIQRADGLIRAWGMFDTHPNAAEASRQIDAQMLRGVSVDVDDASFAFEDADGNPLEGDDADMFDDGTNLVITDGRISGATLVSIPAFQEAFVALGPPPAEWGVQPAGADGIEEVAVDELAADSMAMVAHTITASGAITDYADPQLSGPTPLTITDDGRVYGHLATWGTCHIGFSGQCVTPPESRASYAYFRTGEVLTADGQRVAVGHITLDTGHADPSLAASPAVAHYDNTGVAVADVAAGEDDHGIWLAGRLRAGLDDGVIHALRAAAISGDWRRLGGHLELIAALAVNVPGFMIPRVQTHLAAAGQMTLVASGIVKQKPPLEEDSITAAVMRAMDLIRARERRATRARMIAAKIGRDPATRAALARELVHGGGQ